MRQVNHNNPLWSTTMKKFITTLAATLVIGSAASAATPTFNVYHEEVLPALVAANTPPTFNVVREEILPAMNRVVDDANPFAEQIVGGIGPQLPYDPMRGVDYGFVQALNKLNADPYGEQIVGGIGPQSDLDSMMTLMTDWVQPAPDVDPFSEEVVGGLGPQINFVASN